MRKRWLEGGFIIAFWGFIFMLTVGQRAVDPRGPQGLAPPAVAQAAMEYGLWLLLTPLIFWMSRRFSMERGAWLRHLGVHFAVALAVAIGLNAFGHYTWIELVRGGKYPFSFVQSVASLRFLDEFIIYLAVLAAGFARDYFMRYRERQQEAAELRAQTAELQAQLAEARLHALRMQINPHFLFNTLHAVSTLVERDPRGVRRMIARLSGLLRYTLEHTAVQEVPLHQELEFLRGYLDIQRIRFQGHLQVDEEIEPGALHALVPNLILQPVVENAIKHGVSRIEETGRIVLGARREGDALVLTVWDNGPGLDPSAGDGATGAVFGVGLSNTQERLESLYGDGQRLALEAAPEGGLVVRLTVPYHTAEDLHAIPVLS